MPRYRSKYKHKHKYHKARPPARVVSRQEEITWFWVGILAWVATLSVLAAFIS